MTSRRSRLVLLSAIIVVAISFALIHLTQALARPSGQHVASEPASYATLPEVSLPETSFGIVKNRDTWALPFDLVFNELTIRYRSAASDYLVAACMGEAGYLDFPILNIAEAPLPADRPGGGSRIFSTATSATYGYHVAPDPSYIPSRDGWAQVSNGNYRSLTAQEEQAFASCQQSAAKQLAGPAPTYLGQPLEHSDAPLESLMNAFVVDTAGAAFSRSAAAWRTCMAPLGVPDLPNQPWDVASITAYPESLSDRFSVMSQDPSEAEIAFARHDAGCRESSGWNAALYDATWKQQVEFLSQHRAEFVKLVNEKREQIRGWSQVIVEHGGVIGNLTLGTGLLGPLSTP